MALDLTNNQNPTKNDPTAGKPAASPVASPSVPPVAKSEAAKPIDDSPSQFDLRPPKFWLVLAIIVVAVAVGLLALYFKVGTKGAQPIQTSENATLSTPVSHETPKPPPAISNADDKQALSDYLTNVSTNFKPEYMEKIPQVALDGFKKYQAAGGDEKLEAARTFYIYLNSPGVALGDDIYPEFVKDVQNDLEKALGKKLF